MSTVTTVILLYLIAFLQKNMGVEAIALYIIATCIIWKLAPVQDKNKPLDLDEQKKYRKRVHSLLIIISCISGCLYFWGIYVVPAVVVCVVCQLSIVLIWGKLKNHAHGCTSTVWERTEHMVGINVPISSRIGKKNVKGTMFLICAKQTLISCDFVRKSG